MTFNGRCSNGFDNSLSLYSLVSSVDCSLENRYYDTQKLPVDYVLNNNDNYYDYLNETYPLLSTRLTPKTSVGFGLEYSFYRDTISCLMDSTLDFNTFFGAQTQHVDQLMMNRENIRRILFTFVSMHTYFQFQEGLQIFLLSINCLSVLVNVCVILFRTFKIFMDDKYYGHRCLYFEVYFSFLLDLFSAIVGATSFFILNTVVNFVNDLLNTSCLGDYTQWKLDAYGNDLYDTAEQNLQIFVIMLLKLLIILISILYYYSMKECKVTCKELGNVVYDTIHEGDDKDSPMNEDEVKEEKKRITEAIKKQKSLEENKDRPMDQALSNNVYVSNGEKEELK